MVVASQVEPDSKLADELMGLGIRIQVVGDALNVGYIEGAMHTAHEVAREL